MKKKGAQKRERPLESRGKKWDPVEGGEMIEIYPWQGYIFQKMTAGEKIKGEEKRGTKKGKKGKGEEKKGKKGEGKMGQKGKK